MESWLNLSEATDRRRILVVDDHPTSVTVLCRLLEADYDVETASSGEEALEKMVAFAPDLVLLDVVLPGIDGYETCRRIKSSPCGAFTHVIFISAKDSTSDRLKGYQAEADDYLVKPFNHAELTSKIAVQFRLRDAQLRIWQLNRALQTHTRSLEELVEQRTAEILSTQDVAVFALAKLADSRDTETGEHLLRLRAYSDLLARRLARSGPYVGQIGPQFIRDLYRASPLHDIGKVGIADSILLKPGRLTPEEFDAMKQHVAIGAATLEEAGNSCGGEGHFLDMAANVARYHHERFDGTGYLEGLRGQEIPLAARIVALADVYDALTSERVYKAAIAPREVKTMIEAESGRHFDPAVVDAFRDRFDEFLRVPQLVAGEAEPSSEPVAAGV